MLLQIKMSLTLQLRVPFKDDNYFEKKFTFTRSGKFTK